MIRPAQNQDLIEIQMIYAYARKFMAEHGNPTQWGSTTPREEVLKKDIEKQQLYVIENDARDKILGVFALIIGEDPTYQRIEQGDWKDERLYGTLHRVASAPGAHGILERALDFAGQKIAHLRIDTHADNKVMQHLILKNGFEKCGIIYTDNGSPRFAYEKTGEKNVPENTTETVKSEAVIPASEEEATGVMIQIRIATPADAKEILDIYAPYILQTAITFEYEVPTLAEFTQRMEHTLAKYPYLVAEQKGRIVGYAYAGPLHERAAYDWAVETSIYVRMDAKGQGIGKKLYDELENWLGRQHIVCVNACIAYPDQEPDKYLTRDSVAFHEHLGYQMVGEFHRCAYKFDRWYNMVWMEKSLCERPGHPEPVIWFSKLRKNTVKRQEQE
ncbi:GNAT family N-acetyltransferase [uncultured Eubacterium sp.]|uniref:GNAT family N-acetyltransferase n=1 Tax=uncultured Eubacterium sp. TaxID=165185 RepID=UPI00345D8BCC